VAPLASVTKLRIYKIKTAEWLQSKT